MPFNAETYMVKDSKMANQEDSLTNNLRVDGSMLDKTLGNDDEKDLKKIKQDYKTALIDQQREEYHQRVQKEEAERKETLKMQEDDNKKEAIKKEDSEIAKAMSELSSMGLKADQ